MQSVPGLLATIVAGMAVTVHVIFALKLSNIFE